MPVSRPYYAIVEDWTTQNITRGALPRGTRLTVASVAERLGLSRSPVKRALDTLVNGGVLMADGRLGYIVGARAANSATVANLFALTLPDPADLIADEVRPGWERILDDVTAAVAVAAPFGIWKVSEADLCAHYGVSRTVIREVLARLQERGALGKDRAGHWIAGPLTARMLDEEYGLRVLLEPAAVQEAVPALMEAAPAMRAALDDADAHCPPEVMAGLESDLHDAALAFLSNRRMATTLRQLVAADVDVPVRLHCCQSLDALESIVVRYDITQVEWLSSLGCPGPRSLLPDGVHLTGHSQVLRRGDADPLSAFPVAIRWGDGKLRPPPGCRCPHRAWPSEMRGDISLLQIPWKCACPVGQWRTG